MGHYLSEMGGYDRRPKVSDSEETVIKKFFGEEYTGINSACPRCGAELEWHYTDAENLLLHIKWHENLNAILRHQSSPYPGMTM